MQVDMKKLEEGMMPKDLADAPPDAMSFEAFSRRIMEPRLPLLETRQQTHGSFQENAFISQAIKRIYRNSVGWEHLTDLEREALDMIALKFSRILSGRSMEKQHWEDVTGYAKLVEEKCQ